MNIERDFIVIANVNFAIANIVLNAVFSGVLTLFLLNLKCLNWVAVKIIKQGLNSSLIWFS